MKTLAYISGGLSCMIIIFGSLFRILHLPGANELLMLGMIALSLVYVPSYALYRYRKK